MSIIRGYKAFNLDMTCRGFQFEEGETYTMDGPPVLCESGFHFCKDLVLTLQYYPVKTITDNLYAEIEAIGETVFEEPTQHKGCTNKIKIVRFLAEKEVLQIVKGDSNSGNWNSGDSNSGDWNSGNSNSGYRNSGNRNSGNSNSGDSNSGNWNSGDSNSGDWNSGDSNSGDWNSGYRNSGNRNSGNSNSGNSNSGNRNSGNWNSCNHESGFFNSSQPLLVRAFNKPCRLKDWENSKKPDFLYFTERKDETYKEAFQRSWNESDKENRNLVYSLPNFNAEVFFEISGIDLRSEKEESE